MTARSTRRLFLQTAATAGIALGGSVLAVRQSGRQASAAEPQLMPDLVRFGPDIEPLVRLIEDTPRENCVPVMAEQIRRGLPQRQLLAALYLAAIRAAKWHGGVHGFDHNAYVVHSAHQLALDLPATDQLLPAFYALDNFKGMQQIYQNRPGTSRFTGTPPAAEHAATEFQAAMEEWEPDRAESAIVALVRTQGRAAVLEPLWYYAGRDFGFIGHLAILVANSCRLLETIGWQHAEHVLRYVVAALAGWGKEHAHHSDMQPYWANLERIKPVVNRLPGNWAESEGHAGFTTDLVALLREGKVDDACHLTARQLADGKVHAGAVWDAVHLAAGELMLAAILRDNRSQRNGDALHANTAANALHFAFRMSARSDTRLLLTLQAVSWMSMYRQLLQKKQLLNEALDVTRLTGADIAESSPAVIDEILATRTTNAQRAARMAFALDPRPGATAALMSSARKLLTVKASGDPHDIKFPVAILEDLDLVSPTWRPHLLAAAVFSFWGSDRQDNPLMLQAREALKVV